MELFDTYYEDIPAGTTRSAPFREECRIAPFSGFLSVGVIGESQATVRFSVTVDGAAVVRAARSTTGTTFATVPGQMQIIDMPVRRGSIIAIELDNRDGANAQEVWATFRLGVTKLNR